MDLGSGIRDPGTGKNLFRIPDSGSRIQGSKRHRIPDPGSGSATLQKCMPPPHTEGTVHCEEKSSSKEIQIIITHTFRTRIC
jgi:hypothetical protein